MPHRPKKQPVPVESVITQTANAIDETVIKLACMEQTLEKLKARLDIMTAYQNGQAVQQAVRIPNPEWTDTPNPTWEWADYDYRIKPQPWRASKGEHFFYISPTLKVMETEEILYTTDNALWESGNYFATRKDAEAALEKLKPIFEAAREATTH